MLSTRLLGPRNSRLAPKFKKGKKKGEKNLPSHHSTIIGGQPHLEKYQPHISLWNEVFHNYIYIKYIKYSSTPKQRNKWTSMILCPDFNLWHSKSFLSKRNLSNIFNVGSSCYDTVDIYFMTSSSNYNLSPPSPTHFYYPWHWELF